MALPFEGDSVFERNETMGLTSNSQEIRTISVRGLTSTSRYEKEEYDSDDEEPESCWESTKSSCNSFFMTICPSCITSLPSAVLILLAVLIILFVIVSIPLVFALSYSEPAPLLSNDLGRDYSDKWPGANGGEETRAENFTNLLQIADLLPRNVTQCPGFGFHCVSQPGHVISTNARCNGVADCSDGSDELNCQACLTTFACPLHSNASTLACLLPSALCDEIPHCANEEDELLCNRKCAPAEMSCGNRCLPKSLVCDGEVHCPNGEDEAKCEGCCSNGSKWCKSLKRCLPKDLLCNGRRNCDDGSDEADCDCKTCTGPGKRLCKSDGDKGFCLLAHEICDGVADCPNGEDEENCLGHIDIELPSNQTVICKDGKKYSKAYACSGLVPACSDVCDKSAAPPNFICKADKKSLPAAVRCDGRRDCDDGSDEKDCSPELCAIHPYVMYACEDQKTCFRVGEVCTPSSLCPNATPRDKLYCAGRQSFPGHF